MAFNRDRNNSRSRGGFRSKPSFGNRPRFGDRGDDLGGPVTMHDTICDKCGKSCQVPFRPTSGKPVYCSSCFENKGSSDSRRFEGKDSERSGDRQMFDAICSDCGNSCRVPFQPSGDKAVFCSNCFGDKKNAEGSNGGGNKDKFEQLNAKLDRILDLLSPAPPAADKVIIEEVITEVASKDPIEKA